MILIFKIIGDIKDQIIFTITNPVDDFQKTSLRTEIYPINRSNTFSD